ncbi:MAG: TspO/MBR family protein [Bryobacteraceae bacterium]
MSLLPPSFLPFWMEVKGDAGSPARGHGYALGIFFGVCGLAALYSSVYAPSGEGNWGWYPRLAKPAWAPSPAVTGPVSTGFYAVLAVTIWRIWRTGAFRTVPFTFAGFACLLLLQSMWSTLFYGLQSPLLGLADSIIVLVLAGVLWLTYNPLDTLAGRLWLAYLVWISLLLPANVAIWWLNG